MSYRNSLQADALKLVARKLQSSLAVEGELLVDEGWKAVEVEPEAVAVNGNGHHDANGVEPSVELVMGNGNGHHDGAPEPQQSLFSWAVFMAKELVKPKARSRKPKGLSPSLFDWALSLEQEREEELVGAGR